MPRKTLFVTLAALLAGACAAPPPPIDEPSPTGADHPSSSSVTLAPPSNGIAGSGPDQPAPPQPAPAATPTKNQSPAPNDPGPPAPKAGSSEKCNSQSTFSISEWKKIEAAKMRVDFDVISSVEGSMQVLDHETLAVIEADRSIAIDPVTGGPPTGSFRGLTAVSGQRLLLRADWGDCLVVVVP